MKRKTHAHNTTFSIDSFDDDDCERDMTTVSWRGSW